MQRPALFVLALNGNLTHCSSLERIEGGWRMEIHCEQGTGAIVMLDSGKQFRGNGVFAGWMQEQMSEMDQSLLLAEESRIELLQLG